MEDFRYGNFEPFPKNPHIAQIFTQMGRSEELGTGIKNVFEYNKIYSNADNNDFIDDDVFKTTVPLKIFDNNVVDNDPLNDPLNDRQIRIIKIIKNNSRITKKEVATNLQISYETIKRDFKKLINAEYIKRVGSKKTGYWEIIKH